MGGRIVEQLPRVPTQDFRRRRQEEDRASCPPMAGRKKGFLGPPRLLGQRPLPARAIVGPASWVSLKVGQGLLQSRGGWIRISSPQLEIPKVGDLHLQSAAYVLGRVSPAFRELTEISKMIYLCVLSPLILSPLWVDIIFIYLVKKLRFRRRK